MAITVDYGTCEKCGEKNSKAAQSCRSCGARLPWSKATQAMKKPDASPFQNSSHNASSSASGGAGVSKGLLTQCAGGLVFLSGIGYLAARLTNKVPYIPFLTYGLMAGGAALWRAGSNMSN